MQPIQVCQLPKRRLRFVFNDTSLSFGLPENATFEDIARKLDERPNQGYGDAVAVDVTLRAVPNSILFI